jgi:hypothetical protein
MDRLIAPNTVTADQADTPPATGTPGYATDGNPATQQLATQWPAYQYNAIQEELVAIIAAGGLTPNRATYDQVLTAIKAVQWAQLAPSNNTGAASDVSLAVGESVYVDISAATTAPLHVACADNQSYEIQLQLLGNTGGAALATLAPNNSSYTNFFTWEQLFNSGATPTANQGYSSGFVFAGSDIRYAKSFVSTKTNSKTMNTWAACALSSTAMATNFIVSTWQATASNGGVGDTTTAWTSLGTINFPLASTGRIIVRRVS